MAEKIKYTRKDLKGPDEFISTFGRAVLWSKENQLKITAGILAVAVVLALVLGGKAYFQRQDRKAALEIWPYLKQARLVMATQADANPESLKAVEQTISSLASKYKGTKTAFFAQYFLGDIAFARGDYEASASIYNEAIKKTGRKDRLMVFLLNSGTGKSREATGDYAGAAEAYGKAANSADAASAMRTIAQLDQARALELANKKSEAIALYRKIIEENPESTQKDFIEIKIARME